MLSWKKLVLAITLIGFTAQYAMSADIWVNDLRSIGFSPEKYESGKYNY